MSLTRIKEALTSLYHWPKYELLEDTVLSVTSGLAALKAYSGIQHAREFNASDTKNQVKDDFSATSSMCSLGIMCFSTLQLTKTLISAGIWLKLSRAEQVGILTCTLLGSAGFLYSSIVVGVEQHTLAAGMAAMAGTFFYRTATTGINYKAANAGFATANTAINTRSDMIADEGNAHDSSEEEDSNEAERIENTDTSALVDREVPPPYLFYGLSKPRNPWRVGSRISSNPDCPFPTPPTIS